MPEELTIDTARRLVVSRAWGVFTDDEFAGHSVRLAHHPDFQSTYNQLIDLSGVTALRLTSKAIESVASATAFAPGVRRAVVAPGDAHFGLARMFATFSERTGQDLRVFRTIEAAESYLGATAPNS